ncbi:hypothetical protein CEB3_c42640 [Peptococcaceae bacterium CEB3]|nr:hypothetical protein CEB3_c42640 [Peptococcaceae bacterium CEB3]
MESKIISVSGKRQITIPLKFYQMLHLENEVECTVENGALVVRPLARDTGEFSTQILKELVAQGYSGDELIHRFEQQNENIKKAISKMLDEADKIADGSTPAASYTDIFGADD